MSLRHQPHEDAQAFFLGTLFVSLGVLMFQTCHLLTGGTSGLAFLIHYLTGWAYGPLFFAINLPFYALAYRRMGREFTWKTFAAIALFSVITTVLPQFLSFSTLHPAVAAVLGGGLIGTGMLILFRHKASLGGINVLVLWLQDTRGWRAGTLQMGLDLFILACAFFTVTLEQVLASVVGAVVLNLVLAVNHRQGRYNTMD